MFVFNSWGLWGVIVSGPHLEWTKASCNDMPSSAYLNGDEAQ